ARLVLFITVPLRKHAADPLTKFRIDECGRKLGLSCHIVKLDLNLLDGLKKDLERVRFPSSIDDVPCFLGDFPQSRKHLRNNFANHLIGYAVDTLRDLEHAPVDRLVLVYRYLSNSRLVVRRSLSTLVC